MFDRDITAAFETMRIQYPRLDRAHDALDNLRLGKRVPHGEQHFTTCFAPSQSGKSTVVKTYIEYRLKAWAIREGLFPPDISTEAFIDQQRLVIYVTLNDQASARSVASDILLAMGDEFYAVGTTHALLQRVYDYCRKLGVQLIILDEIQHLRGKTPKDAAAGSSASNTLKVMLLRGLAPMVFLGDETAAILASDKQFSNRQGRRLPIGRLDPAIVEDCETFATYCGKTGVLLQRLGLFRKRSNFKDPFLVDCVFEVSGGLLGMASRLFMNAAFLAANKAEQVDVGHLAEATDVWAIGELKLLERNPFRERPLRSIQGQNYDHAAAR